MERYFDENHRMIRDLVREFARNEVAPVAARLDQTGEFPWENVRKMAELGLLGVPWPDELGGAGNCLVLVDQDTVHVREPALDFLAAAVYRRVSCYLVCFCHVYLHG